MRTFPCSFCMKCFSLTTNFLCEFSPWPTFFSKRRLSCLDVCGPLGGLGGLDGLDGLDELYGLDGLAGLGGLGGLDGLDGLDGLT